MKIDKKCINDQDIIDACLNSESMAKACAKLGMHWNTFVKYAKNLGCYKPNQSGKGTHKAPTVLYNLQDILDGKHIGYQTYKLKNKLLAAGLKENKCEICGITEWNGKPLKMELHHIDEDKNNYSLDNLQMLCPNCHSQTDNFRSKNNSNCKSKLDD